MLKQVATLPGAPSPWESLAPLKRAQEARAAGGGGSLEGAGYLLDFLAAHAIEREGEGGDNPPPEREEEGALENDSQGASLEENAPASSGPSRDRQQVTSPSGGAPGEGVGESRTPLDACEMV